MRKIYVIFSMILVFGSLAHALVLENVEFKGLHQLSNESALQISGLKIGQNLNSEAINAAILNYLHKIILAISS